VSSSSWRVYKEGLPECIDADDVSALPSEVQFSFIKNIQFILLNVSVLLAVFSEYVKQHWREDAFFGYQFLNGVNPMMIRHCKSLPKNFPVTDVMVKLEGNRKLSQEIKKGNMFLCDYKDLDGVTTSHINDEEQYLAAPLVLFHKTPDDELKPVAIQLKQTPAEDNPIFVSSDSEYDWLLAKIFVRSADFNEQQLNAHLLRTHLLAEVFTVALLRNLPKVHPLHKLLIHHTRFTLHINLNARKSLISEDGVFTSFSAASAEGMTKLMQRSHSAVTYESLCIKDDIKERGLESVPNFYYRDDGFKFVKGVLTYYYKKDEEIKRDTELCIKQQTLLTFCIFYPSGIPQRFETVDELVKFVTMVIFTCSAQHAAVNNGQADYGSWMPNTPTSLQKPPPTQKGTVTEQTVLQTLPDRNATQISSDFVALGHFPDEHFTEEVPCRLMRQFCAELDKLDKEIDDKNKKRKLPYIYLKPTLMENSVSI
uniref:Lipoxygenase domain-containing protein n=1 Tax=Neogobius melanostomus TaxID=47308 RepID=A0A8C6S5M3_9GOBI